MMPMLMKLPKERGDGAVDQEVSGAADQNNNKDDDVNSEDDKLIYNRIIGVVCVSDTENLRYVPQINMCNWTIMMILTFMTKSKWLHFLFLTCCYKRIINWNEFTAYNVKCKS